MIGRRAVVGLSLLSALLFCAFAAQSASAVKSTNTTFFTCEKGAGSLDFSKAHCDAGDTVTPGKGEYGHKLIPLNTTTEIEVSNEKVTNNTTEDEPVTLKGKVAGAKIDIECTKVTTSVDKNGKSESNLHNVETEVAGKKVHTATGTVAVHYSECKVTELAKCTVKEPIPTRAVVTGVEELGALKNEMGLEFTQDEGKPFFELTFEGAECAVKGKTFNVTGSTIGTSGPTTTSSQTNRESGATVVFTAANGMQNLKLGPEAAEFSSIFTLTMFGAGGSPITATTVT
jgi:hypothetical protein